MLMGIAALIRPRTRGWGRSRDAIASYVGEQEQRQRKALSLRRTRSEMMSGSDVKDAQGQVPAGRLLPRLRARGHGPRLQPLDQGGRQGARAQARRGAELELLRGDGSEERRPEDPDVPVVARPVDRRQRDACVGRDGALQRLLSQPQEGRIRPREGRVVARGRRPHLGEGRPRDLPGRAGRDDPRARLDQARHRREAPCASACRTR